VALVPIELTLETFEGGCEGYHADKNFDIYDFPLRFHELNPETQTREERILKKWPKEVRLTYVVSGMEATTLLYSKDEQEYTGNESATGENHYLCGAMVVLKR